MPNRRTISAVVSSPGAAALLLLGLVAAWASARSAAAVPLQPVLKLTARRIDDILELAGRAGKHRLDAAARRALRPTVARALRLYGDDAVRAVVRRGGLEILEASAKYGDDVFRFAREVPAAVPVLAARTEELLPLARRLGPDILRIEAAHPGLARAVTRLFPAADARLFHYGAGHPDDILRIASVAEHIPDPRVRRYLFRAFADTRNKSRFIELLFQKITWKTIMAGGVSIAMIEGVHRAADGLGAVARSLPPEAVARLGRRAVDWGGGAVLLAAGGIFLVFAAAALRLAHAAGGRLFRLPAPAVLFPPRGLRLAAALAALGIAVVFSPKAAVVFAGTLLLVRFFLRRRRRSGAPAAADGPQA